MRQIEAGAPADIFFSADEAKMNDAANKDLLVNSSRRSLLSNQLPRVVRGLTPDGPSAMTHVSSERAKELPTTSHWATTARTCRLPALNDGDTGVVGSGAHQAN